MKNNPFNLTFGKEPAQMIERYAQTDEIIGNFTSESPSQQVYMITGVRGSGKTVFMTSICKKLASYDNWIVIELNSSGELLKELAAKLYDVKGMSGKYKADGIDLSVFGIGLSVKVQDPVTDLSTAVEKMLAHLAKEKKKVLVTIDEVIPSPDMKYFVGTIQMLIRHDYPVFILMTGLYENINSLSSVNNLTFLFRAPKIYLAPLSINRIADHYESLLEISKEEATELAKMTKGYPFAFQVFGYFAFKNTVNIKRSLPDIKGYLNEYVYDKLWIEFSEKEKSLLELIAVNGIKDVKTLRDTFNNSSNEFSIYRDRLVKKGILDGSRRGHLDLTLPFLEDYIRNVISGYDFDHSQDYSILCEMMSFVKVYAAKTIESDGSITLKIDGLDIEATEPDEASAKKQLASRIRKYAEEFSQNRDNPHSALGNDTRTLYAAKALTTDEESLSKDIICKESKKRRDGKK